jgi:rubredoxin
VLYSKKFDPNTQEYIAYAQDVDKIELPGLLMELSRMYFDQLGAITPSSNTKSNANEAPKLSEVHQCSNCMTLYDSAYGDERFGITQNTSFENLPEDYCCSVCEGEKKLFKKVLI